MYKKGNPVIHLDFGEGVVKQITENGYKVWFKEKGVKIIPMSCKKLTLDRKRKLRRIIKGAKNY